MKVILIEEMTYAEMCEEAKKRLGLGQDFDGTFLGALRAKGIGDENLQPPEPEHHWFGPEVIPPENVDIVVETSDLRQWNVRYFPYFENEPFWDRCGEAICHYGAVARWRYAKSPWRIVARDGEPGEYKRYYTLHKHQGIQTDVWTHRGTWLVGSNRNVLAYCPIPPAPPFPEGEGR